MKQIRKKQIIFNKQRRRTEEEKQRHITND